MLRLTERLTATTPVPVPKTVSNLAQKAPRKKRRPSKRGKSSPLSVGMPFNHRSARIPLRFLLRRPFSALWTTRPSVEISPLHLQKQKFRKRYATETRRKHTIRKRIRCSMCRNRFQRQGTVFHFGKSRFRLFAEKFT